MAQLVHLYVDGAFSRRELVKRVARRTGSVAAALAALGGFEAMHGEGPSEAPAGLRTSESEPGIDAREVTFPGEAGVMYGYLAVPRNAYSELQPGVIVVHENRGLVEHIKDVTRRAAKAGFVSLAVDLLSRQGGAAQFTEPTQQSQAYNRTNQTDRRADLLAGLDFLKRQDTIVFDRIGMTGFCAGGGNVWDFVVNISELVAAVPFYGTPPTLEELERVQTPVWGMYAERDRTLTGRIFPVADAWARTVAFFNKWLRAPRA